MNYTRPFAAAIINALSLATVSALPAHAANQTWQGDALVDPTDWSDTSNWNGNALPGSSDTAFFGGSATGTQPTLNGTQSIGTVNISGSQSFTFGQTTGVLYMRNATALTSTSSANQTFTGSSYRASRTGDSTFTNNGTGLIDFETPVYKEDPVGSGSTNNGNLIFGGTGNFEVHSVGKRYSGLTGGLTKNGAGTLTILGAVAGAEPAALTGPVTIANSGGTLRIQHPLALGSGNITIAKAGTNSGTLELALTGTNTISNTFNGFSSSTRLGLPGGSAQIVNISGINTISSNLTVTGTGGSGLIVASNGGLLELAGTLSATVDTSRVVALGGSGNGLVSGVIMGSGSGAGPKTLSVRKEQSGTWTLTNANSYAGDTVIDAGLLLVNGSHAGGNNYAVALNATLGGIGSIETSNFVVDGNLAPGGVSPAEIVESLTVTAPVTFNTLSQLSIQIDESSAMKVDLLDIIGNLSVASGASVDFSVTGPLTLPEYIFGKYTGTLSGAFASTTVPANYDLVQEAGELKLVQVPEPGTLAILLFGSLTILLVRKSR